MALSPDQESGIMQALGPAIREQVQRLLAAVPAEIREDVGLILAAVLIEEAGQVGHAAKLPLLGLLEAATVAWGETYGVRVAFNAHDLTKPEGRPS